MELFFIEGLSTWEATRENIPDGMYTLIEFNDNIWRMVRHLLKIYQRIPPQPPYQVQRREIFLIFKEAKRSF